MMATTDASGNARDLIDVTATTRIVVVAQLGSQLKIVSITMRSVGVTTSLTAMATVSASPLTGNAEPPVKARAPARV
jgi:hypothetical protein